MRAILFPGQGSQYVGMGQDFYQKFDSTKKTFEIVDKALGFSLSKIVFNGPEEELKLTKNTQPAIMTVGVCIFNILKKEYKYDFSNSKFFAGHSLGEYTALVCSGSLTIERAAYLLHERGKFMQEAVKPEDGSMIAVLGMSVEEVETEINLIKENDICEIANDNSYGQGVVSCKKKAIEKLYENLKIKKKKGIFLPVSAPFHCSLMQKAAENMRNKIEETNFLEPNPKIISNVTAKEEHEPNKIKPLLVDQITSRVRWRESVEYMVKNGVDDFIEIGPGKVLSGLVKKINKNVKTSNINSTKDLLND